MTSVEQVSSDVTAGVTFDVNVTEFDQITFDLAVIPVFTVDFFGGVPGPPGPAGPTGGQILTGIAATNLSAGRVVISSGGEFAYFQPANLTHFGRAYGITTSSAVMGGSVQVQVLGNITDASYTFVADTVLWVGLNGELTTTVPTSGLLQRGGVCLGDNTVRIDFAQQIIIN